MREQAVSAQGRVRAVIEAAGAIDKLLWASSGLWVEDAGLDIGMLFAEEMVVLREALEALDGSEEAIGR